MTDLRTRVLGLLRPHTDAYSRTALADDVVTAAAICESDELRSLRGVVQAVEATVKAYSDGAMPNMREFVHQLRAALAAAAAMSDDALDALRSLEKDTTPGPWRADTEHSPVSPKIVSACMIRTDNEWPGPAMTRQLRDAAFIVAAVEYVRAALAAAADAPQPEPAQPADPPT